MCVAGRANKTGVQVLSTYIRQRQVIESHPNRPTVFKGVVQHPIVQVPSDIGWGSACVDTEY